MSKWLNTQDLWLDVSQLTLLARYPLFPTEVELCSRGGDNNVIVDCGTLCDIGTYTQLDATSSESPPTGHASGDPLPAR